MSYFINNCFPENCLECGEASTHLPPPTTATVGNKVVVTAVSQYPFEKKKAFSKLFPGLFPGDFLNVAVLKAGYQIL